MIDVDTLSAGNLWLPELRSRTCPRQQMTSRTFCADAAI